MSTNKNNFYVLGILLIAAIGVSGCAQLKELAAKTSELFTGNKKVPIVYTHAPNDSRMADAKVNKIIVSQFKGDSGNTQFTEKVSAKISSLRHKGQNCYTVVAREELPKLVNANWSPDTFSISESDKASMLRSADTIMLGSVSLPRTSHQNVRRQRTDYKTCVEVDKKGKCTKHREYYVNCNVKTANMEFTVKAVNIDSSQVVFSRSYIGSSKNEHCPDDTTPAQSTFQLESNALNDSLKKLSADIAPYKSVQTPRVWTDDDELQAHTQVLQLFDAARDLVADKNYDQACKNYQQAASLFESSPSLNFNVGICKERAGDFESAVAYYQKANNHYMRIENEQDEEILKRLTTAQTMLQQQSKVDGACQSTSPGTMTN